MRRHCQEQPSGGGFSSNAPQAIPDGTENEQQLEDMLSRIDVL
jgi:hypothetical protein